MVKPNNEQLRELIELREFVIEVMTSMGVWSEELLTKLTNIDLGVLRKNATQRHGVTRWRQGIRNPTIPEEVKVIELSILFFCDSCLFCFSFFKKYKATSKLSSALSICFF